MENNNRKAESFRKWAIRLAFLGLIILVAFLILMAASGMLFGWKINPEYTGLIGTFIGGTIGAIWSLAGVLLYYAALMYQRNELLEITKSRLETASALEKQNDAYIKQIEIANSQHFLSLYLPILEKFEKAVNVLQTTNTFRKHLDFTEDNDLNDKYNYTGFEIITHKFEQFSKLYPNMFIDGFEYESEAKDKILSSIGNPILKLNFAIYGEKFFLLLKLIDQRFEEDQTDDTTKYLLDNLLRERTNEQLLSLIYYSIAGYSTYLTFKYIGRRFRMNYLPQELTVSDEDHSTFILSMVNKYYSRIY